MKTNALIAGIVIALANAAVLIGILEAYAAHVQAASVAFGLWLVLRSILTKTETSEEQANPANERADKAASPAPSPKNQAESEIIAFLGELQDKGRLVDFVMDDIAAYGDAQVGAAARVVHQGCKEVLSERFKISPVANEAEGSQISVPGDSKRSDYRLSGNVDGAGPFSGKLVHKGWKTDSVKLPRIAAEEGRLPVIAPAQVEIR